MQFKKYEAQTSRVKRLVEAYSRMVLNNNVDYIKLKNIYQRQIKDEYAEWNIRKIIRQTAVQPMITEKLIELTEKHGITAQQSLEARKRILDIAIEKGDLTNANKALDSFDVKLDLHPIKQQQITTTETNYLQLLSKDKGITKQITAKQTKELQPSTSTSTDNSKETSQNDADND